MSREHDDRGHSDYGSYRSNRDVRESSRGGGGYGGGYDGDRGYDRERRGGGGGSRVERDPRCKCFVEGLDYGTSWQDLKDHMRRVGHVEYVKIYTSYDGRSKGCGLCEYSNIEDCETAIAELNGTTLGERRIIVREDRGVQATRGGGGGGRGDHDRGGRDQGRSRDHERPRYSDRDRDYDRPRRGYRDRDDDRDRYDRRDADKGDRDDRDRDERDRDADRAPRSVSPPDDRTEPTDQPEKEEKETDLV